MAYLGQSSKTKQWDTYDKADVDSKDALKADTTYVNNKPTGFKNYIINGGFDIWQRGTSFSVAGYTADRFFNSIGSISSSIDRVTYDIINPPLNTNTPKYVLQATNTASTAVSNEYSIILQRVEGVRTLQGKKATFSFWAKSDGVRNISIEFIQKFGTGGTPSADVTGIGVTKIALSTTFTKYSVTVDIPSIEGKTLGTDGNDFLGVYIWQSAGTSFASRTDSLITQNGVFSYFNLQLEEGSVATPFEQRPYGLELSLCQRYYQSISDVGHVMSADAVGRTFRTNCSFQQMRVQPTAIFSTISTNNVTSITRDLVGNGTVFIQGSSTSVGIIVNRHSVRLDAEL